MIEPEHVDDTPLAAELMIASGLAALEPADLAKVAALHRRFARDRAVVASMALRSVEPMVTFAPLAATAGADDEQR